VIDIDESPVKPEPEPTIPPAKRRATKAGPATTTAGPATVIPNMPDFKLGYAEKERQNADQRVNDRKTKVGYLLLMSRRHIRQFRICLLQSRTPPWLFRTI